VSETDSFIEEVTEEVRRDRLFQQFRRYGWIAVLAVVLLVAGASWNEWNKAQQRAQAQALGDQILAALEAPERAARAEALAQVEAPGGGVEAVIALLTAGEESGVDPQEAATRLMALADDPDVPQVYRQIAVLKGVSIADNGMSADDRRTRLEGLLPGGGLVRLLAEEQLALIDMETGATGAALDRLRDISENAEATPGLRRRVAQLIVALNGDETAPADGATQGD
jgi:hypothetical protein